MTVHEMQALIDRLEGHLAWMQDFGPDGTLRDDLKMVVEYLKKVCPPRESVFAAGSGAHRCGAGCGRVLPDEQCSPLQEEDERFETGRCGHRPLRG
jgi:hypothetical protein